MKFACSAGELEKAIKFVNGFSNSKLNIRYGLVALSVKGSTLTLKGTDGVTYCILNVPVEVEKEGEVIVKPELFLDVVKTLGTHKEVVISGDKRLFVRQGNLKRYISTYNTTEVAPVPDMSGTNSFDIPLDFFLEAIRSVNFAKAESEMRPVLTGIYLGGNGTLLAGDGIRAALTNIGTLADADLILSPRIYDALQSMADFEQSITLSYSNESGWVSLKGEQSQIWVSRLGGVYPQLKGLIDKLQNKGGTEVKLTRSSMLTLLKMSCLFAKRVDRVAARVELLQSSIKITIETPDGKQEDELILKENRVGDAVTFYVNPVLLKEAVEAAPAEFTLKVKDAQTPVLIYAEDWLVLNSIMHVGKEEENEQSNSDTDF